MTSVESMKRGSVRPGPHFTRCTAVVLVVLVFICVLLLVQFWKVSGLRNEIHESYALLQQKYQLLSKKKFEIDAKLTETKDNVESIEQLKKEAQEKSDAKEELLKAESSRIAQLQSSLESLQTNLSVIQTQLSRYGEANQLLTDRLNRSQTELDTLRQRLAEQKQSKHRQVAVNLLALNGNEGMFAAKDNFVAKVVMGNFTTVTSTTAVSSTAQTSSDDSASTKSDGGFFAQKIAAQRQLQGKLPTQLSLGQQVTVESADTLAKPVRMFEEKKQGGVGGLDDKEGESDSQFMRPRQSDVSGKRPSSPSPSLNPLENGEDKAREQLQGGDNTEDQESPVDP